MRQIEMHAGDGVAHLLGLADQRVALMRQRLEQAADADFVVVVGALERRRLRWRPALRARRRARARARRRRPWRRPRGGSPGRRVTMESRATSSGSASFMATLGHRLGDDAHLLRAPHHVGEHVEEHDRRQHEAGKPDHGRDAGRALLQHRLQIGQIEERQRDAARRPGEREHGRHDIGAVGRALLQAVQDLPDRLAVVIGGELARPRVVGGEAAPDPRTGPFRGEGSDAYERVRRAGSRGGAAGCAGCELGGLSDAARRMRSGPAGWPSWPRRSGPSASSGCSPCRPSPHSLLWVLWAGTSA